MDRKSVLVCRGTKQLLVSFLLLSLTNVFTLPAQAQTTATTTPIAYARPSTGMLQAGDKNFYAPSQRVLESCINDTGKICSYVYKMTPDGTTSVFHEFPALSTTSNPPTNSDGVQPMALIVGTDGNLYGACQLGGPGGGGTIFKIDLTLPASQNFTVLKSFGSTATGVEPGYQPLSLIQAADGSFYFTNGLGVYQLVINGNAGTVNTIYTFPTSNQGSPNGTNPTSIMQADDGNLYLTLNTAPQAATGTGTQGAIAKLTPGGALVFTYTLAPDGNQGDQPLGPLTEGPDHNLYGVTLFSGNKGANPGVAFKISLGGDFSVLHSFANNGRFGQGTTSLLLGSDGNFYGATITGGNTTADACTSLGCGSFYKLDPAGNFTDLHDFTGGAPDDKNPPLPPTLDGASPTTPLVQTDGGFFYGTQLGNQKSIPIVYKAALTPAIPSPIQLSFDPSPAIPGEPTTLTWKVLNAFSQTAQQCSASIVGNPSGAGTWTGPQTGTLSGGVYSGSAQIVPTANGLFTYGLTCGGKESGFFTLTVNKDGALKIVTTNDTIAKGTVFKQYDSAVTAVGGFGTYQWSIVDGQLPPGLNFDETTGALSGVPTQWGSYPLSFKVVDESKPQEEDTQSITIVVKSGLTLVPNLPNPILNASYNISLVPDATGGISPYTWEIISGKLPTGLTLDTISGLISGKSTEAGSFTFTIKVTDSEDTPDQTQATVTLKVAGPLQINTTTSLPPAAVGEPYAVTFEATGGTPPYTWDFGQNGAGAVPPGMGLTSDGTFAGTPTQYSTAVDGINRFNVVVSDSSTPKQQIPTTFFIAVNKTLKIETTSLPNGTVGVLTDVPLSASGGIPPYTWTAATLPNPNIGVQVVNGNVLEYNPTIAMNSIVVLTVKDSEPTTPDVVIKNDLTLITLPLQLPTTTTFTTSNAAPGTNQLVTFTAKVTPSQGTVTPTGQVTFFNGPNILGIAPLNANGIATFQTSFAAPGSYSITAAYGGSNTYAPSTSGPLTEAVVTAGVSITLRPTSLTVRPGGIGVLITTLTSFGGYTGTVSLSCGPTPAHISCAVLLPNLNLTPGRGTLLDALIITVAGGRRAPAPGTYTIPITMTVPGGASQNLSARLVVQ